MSKCNTMSPLVLMPARNEESTVADIVKQIRNELGWDVVVIDDASTDSTVEYARNAGATVLPLSMNLGAWGATQTGIRYALAMGYQQAIAMDADGQHNVQSIRQLQSTMESEQADVVIGSCIERGSRPRRAAWRFFRAITGITLDDLTSGFRIYNRPAMAVLALREATLLEYQDIGILLLLRRAGLEVEEVNVPMHSRSFGHSRVFYSWFAVGYYLLHTAVLCISKRR